VVKRTHVCYDADACFARGSGPVLETLEILSKVLCGGVKDRIDGVHDDKRLVFLVLFDVYVKLHKRLPDGVQGFIVRQQEHNLISLLEPNAAVLRIQVAKGFIVGINQDVMLSELKLVQLVNDCLNIAANKTFFDQLCINAPCNTKRPMVYFKTIVNYSDYSRKIKVRNSR